MRKDFGAKPLSYPQTVFMIGTYGKDGVPDLMNAAWAGICGEDKVAICVDRTHKTTENLLYTKEFTVSMATEDTLVPCDYVGIVSGNDVPDKVARSGLTPERSRNVNAPLFKELPMALECKMVSYDDASEVLIGQIVNVTADESVLTDGKIDPLKLKPITYDSSFHGYYGLSKRVGSAFKDGRRLE